MHIDVNMRYELKEFLVKKDLCTQEQIDWSFEAARIAGGTWLDQLLLYEVVDEERLCQEVSAEVCVPRCDLRRLANLPREVVACIPAEVTAEHHVLPLWLEPDGDLRVAMVDPLDAVAVTEVQFFAGRRLLREVAVASAIAWAMHHYHGLRSPLWPRQSVVRSSEAYTDEARVMSEGKRQDDVRRPAILQAMHHLWTRFPVSSE